MIRDSAILPIRAALTFIVSILFLTMSIFKGIITEGGTKANIIPSRTTMEFILRAPDDEELIELTRKVKTCFQSAADATGCSVEVVTKAGSKNLAPNKSLAQVYQRFAESFG